MEAHAFEILFAVFAFALGACIGSFLNVCIYRLPLDMPVNKPSRSFCPNCKYQIPWYHNLPLFSWLFLRGKCANCGQPISFRYFGVELLTALLFLGVWLELGISRWALAFPYWIMVSLFVIATFIDFEHFMIPDEITWGGAAAGVLLSLALPQLHNEQSPIMGAVWSVAGAAAGYLVLWLVVELGKKAFGKKDFRLTEPAPFTWTRIPGTAPEGGDSDADLVVGDIAWKNAPTPGFGTRLAATGHSLLRLLRIEKTRPASRGESWRWSDMFFRESDRLIIRGRDFVVDGTSVQADVLTFTGEELHAGQQIWRLEKTDFIKGTAQRLTIPREAMGFGDVKFIACIGAFLGWQAVLFTVMSASMIGAFVGVSMMVLGRREWSAKIPFGPYLALGALIWLFTGPEIVSWYLGLMSPPPGA